MAGADRPCSVKSEANHWKRILEVLGDVELRAVDARGVADYIDGLVALTGFGFCASLVGAVTAPFLREPAALAAAVLGVLAFGAAFTVTAVRAERTRSPDA